jgi:hypothetical protein
LRRQVLADAAVVAAALLIGMLSVPVATYGLAQIAGVMGDQVRGRAHVSDFLAYHTAAHILVHEPERLYDASLQRVVQSRILAGGDAFLPYVSPPHVALLQAPLGLLPYGPAYAAWLALALGCLAASAYLIAPRPPGRASWLVWLLAAPLFVPVLLGMGMGQSSCLMLLGYCLFVRCLERERHFAGGLALLVWTLKPNLLAAHLVALIWARDRRALGALGAASLLVLALAIVRIGPDGLAGFVEAARVRLSIATLRPDGFPEGATLLVVSQALLGATTAASVVAVAGSLAICMLVGHAWRNGLRAGASRHLQLAMLPMAATLASLHAGIYELTIWLASIWLLLAYARAVPAERYPVLALVLVIWASSNVAVIAEASPLMLASVAVVECCVLAGVLWLLRAQLDRYEV